MNIKIKGLKPLMNSCLKASEEGLLSKKLLNDEAKQISEILKAAAPVDNSHNIHGKKYILVNFKKNSKRLKVVEIGLDEKKTGGAAWKVWKGLYYNNYGFKHHYSGKHVEKHKLWFNKAVEKNEREIIRRIEKNILEKLENVF